MKEHKIHRDEKAALAQSEFDADHKALHTILSRIEGTSDLRELGPLLKEMERLLEPHFAREEGTEGLYGVISETAPQHLGRYKELMNEHGEFLATIRDLTQKIEVCLSGPIAEIKEGTSGLCGRLRRHESKENQLLTDSLYVDLGGSE